MTSRPRPVADWAGSWSSAKAIIKGPRVNPKAPHRSAPSTPMVRRYATTLSDAETITMPPESSR